MVFMIGMNWSLNGLLWRQRSTWRRFICAIRSFLVACRCDLQLCHHSAQRPRYFAAIGFDIQWVSFGSEASDVVPSSMASNPNSSFRQDSTKRHVFRLDTIYLNVRPIRARIYFRCDRIRSPFDGVDRHCSLRALCLNNSYRFAIITCRTT